MLWEKVPGRLVYEHAETRRHKSTAADLYPPKPCPLLLALLGRYIEPFSPSACSRSTCLATLRTTMDEDMSPSWRLLSWGS